MFRLYRIGLLFTHINSNFSAISARGGTSLYEANGDVQTLTTRDCGDVPLMGSHFHDWTDYNGVAFSKELLEWGRTFSDFWGGELFIFTVSKCTRMFVQ